MLLVNKIKIYNIRNPSVLTSKNYNTIYTTFVTVSRETRIKVKQTLSLLIVLTTPKLARLITHVC